MIFGFFKKKKERKKAFELECILCFKANTFSTADLMHLFDAPSSPFRPHTMQVYDDPIPFTDKEREKLLNMSPAISEKNVSRGFELIDESGTQSLRIVQPAHASKPHVLYWRFPKEQMNEVDGPWLQALVAHPNFVVAYCGDAEDMMLQSSSHLHHFTTRGLKPARTKKNEFGDVQVDISRNPGRMKLVRDRWLMSCWRMWFGQLFYNDVPKEKIHSFPNAHTILDLENGVILVELYADPFDAERPENRRVQQRFRDWINMDDLEKKLAK